MTDATFLFVGNKKHGDTKTQRFYENRGAINVVVLWFLGVIRDSDAPAAL